MQHFVSKESILLTLETFMFLIMFILTNFFSFYNWNLKRYSNMNLDDIQVTTVLFFFSYLSVFSIIWQYLLSFAAKFLSLIQWP